VTTEGKEERGSRKERRGVVVSRSGDKTIVVRVETRQAHPLYGKVLRQFRRFCAHDAENAAQAGDTVRIVETRPLSRRKRWRLVEIVSRDRRRAAEAEGSETGEPRA
jgi:small subunit ribosomal protein S17